MAILSVKDFIGGKTDFAVGANPSQFENADNLVINEYGDLEHRPGTLLDFTTSGSRARLPTNARVGLLAPQTTGAAAAFTILKQSGTKLFYDNGTARTELVGPGSASAFNVPSLDTEVSFSYSEWNNHTFITHESPWQLPVMIYRDSSGVLRLRTAGLPPVAGSSITAVGGAGGSYIYAFVYKYSYTVGSTTYEIRSRPYLKSFTNIASDPSAANITVGSIPTLSSGTGEHYDTTTIKVEIYRTTNGGSVLYYVNEVTNGTASYIDSAANATLQTANNTLYTTGGVSGNDRAPKCKFVHSTSDFTYWANGYEVTVGGADGEYLPQRVWQSKRGGPYSVPASFYADIEEPITAISSVKSIPIVFGANSVYRLDGTFDNNGRGGMSPRKISDRVGCVGHLSVVQTLDGLYFAGNDGFYFTDGYKIYSLSAEDFKATYKRLVETDLQKKRIYGTYDSLNKRVLWSVHDPDGDTTQENNTIFCMYLPAKKFTTWSSGSEGRGYYNELTVTAAGTTLTLGSTEGISAGDFIRIPGVNTFDMYVTSVDSTTQLSINTSAGVGPVTVQFFVNEPIRIDVFGNFQPSSLLFANQIVWQGDGRGFTLKYDNDTLSDVQIDERWDSSSSDPIVPIKRTILFNYSGPILDLGTTEFRKWVNSVVVKARPRSDISANVAIQPYGENDDSNSLQELKEIFATSFYPWGAPLISYGDPALYRRRQQIVDEIRRFPKGRMRCEYKQVHLKSAFVNLYNSTSYGEGTISVGSAPLKTKVLTITGQAPSDLYNSWITFETDDYTAEYKILSQTETTITFLDPAGAIAVGAGAPWIIRSYPTNNFVNLVEYTLYYEVMSATQSSFRATSGQNT